MEYEEIKKGFLIWWERKLNEASLPNKISCRDIRDEFYKEIGAPDSLEEAFRASFFGTLLKSYCPDRKKSRENVRGKQEDIFIFPNLEEARKSFSKATGKYGLWN